MQNDSPRQVPAELTEREQEILRLVAKGTSNKEIAQQLFISSNTVKVHLRNIFSKIGVASRTEAAVYAIHSGLARNADLPEAESALQDLSSPPKKAISRIAKRIILAISVLLMTILVGSATLTMERYSNPTAAAPVSPQDAPQRWKTLADLPTARTGLAVAVYENQIYAIGGETPQGITGVMEQYDVSTDKWTTLKPKPLAVTDINAQIIGGQIYIPGGRLSSGATTDIFESYDLSQKQWQRRSSLPVALSGYALAAFEGKLYVFGGWDGQKFTASVYEYDPNEDKWSVRSPMPTPRAFAGAAIAGGKIYVLGGYNGTSALSVNEAYLPERDSWSKGHNLPAGRYAMGTVSIADLIYVVGGEGGTNAALPHLQYSYQQDQWQAFEDPLHESWSHLGLVPMQTRLIALGGTIGGESSARTLSYQAIYSVFMPVSP
jgi:DNA-binding CsgD family transcriptional regulator/N-acetylneuraminic acid mutarotase